MRSFRGFALTIAVAIAAIPITHGPGLQDRAEAVSIVAPTPAFDVGSPADSLSVRIAPAIIVSIGELARVDSVGIGAHFTAAVDGINATPDLPIACACSRIDGPGAPRTSLDRT